MLTEGSDPVLSATPTVASAAELLASSIAKALRRAGTRVVYGIPGGGNNLELIEACEDAGLRFVLTHGETAAAIMASVDGELSGAPGACIVTRGPGAASAVNGLAQALLDRAPLALVTDAVGWEDRRRIQHQWLDQTELLRPVTKWSGTIGADGAEDVIAAALAFATEPAPGPVHLDFVPDAPRGRGPAIGQALRRCAKEEMSRALTASRRPVFALGVGARRAIPAVRELLAETPWPVLTTYKAKGAIPETWSNAAGLLTGAEIEGPVLRAADLIVAVGLDPVELIPAEWPYPAPVLSLGEWSIANGYFSPACEAVGPLDELLALVGETLPTEFNGPRFGREWRIASEAALMEAPAEGIGPQDVVRAARDIAPAGTVATVDSGAHMLVTMPLWGVESIDEVLISSGLATMGFALPAAVAASIARPDRHIICFVGDGGMDMTLGELETLARLSAQVAVVVFNDSALSLIEVKQKPGRHGGRNAVCYCDTDFAGIAASVGIASRRVASRHDLEAALVEAFARPRPFLVDVEIDARAYPQIMSTIRGGPRA